MLLVVGTEATVVGATIMNLVVEFQWCLGRFVVVAGTLVVLNIGSYKHLKETMLFAGLQHVYLFVFKNNFCLYAFQAVGAKANGEIVISIFSYRHFH
jgi:hypothetical protein